MPIIKEEDTFKKEEVMSEINITPLTDVFLVLLVIFMIATPLLVQSGIKVKLPCTEVVDTPSQGIIVTVTEDSKIYIDEEEISISSLQNKLLDKLSKNSEKLVILQGDKNVLLGNAVEIMDIAKLAGAKNIAVATELKKENQLFQEKGGEQDSIKQ